MTPPNAGEDVEQQEPSITAGGNAECMHSHSGDSLAVSHKTQLHLAQDLAIALLGIYPKELKTYVYPKTCIQMFTAALFIIVKTWNQQRHPSVGE